MKAIDVVVFQEFINKYRQSQEERVSKGLGLQYFRPQELQLLLNKIPTIEVEPVRHGRWTPTRPYMHSAKCTVCGNIWDLETPRCPSCGAKMDLEEPIDE